MVTENIPKYSSYYRFKNQFGILIYVGRKNGWHQFSLAYNYDGRVWAEVIDVDIMKLLEEVPTPLDLPALTDDLATNLDALTFVKPKTSDEALDAHLDNSFYKP